METGRRSELFREVNDRIYELLASAEPDLPGEFLCECGEDCGRRVELLPAAFEALRSRGRAVCSSECGRGGLLRVQRPDVVSRGVPVLSE
jgi:hypothetical protein